ncbi:MAG: hypothetical protein QOE65_2562 [Solirubrobacteraceae bacterium]|nr:hypothetical protein [Solirubrobacteraceae bacterium]
MKGACTFAAAAKTNPPVQLVGGGGEYVLNSLSFACVGVTKGVPSVDLLVISSRGTYLNVVCGVGVVWSKPGQSVLVAGPPKEGPAVAAMGYEIDFVYGVGTLNWKTGSFAGKGLPGISPLTDLGFAYDPKSGPGSFGGIVGFDLPTSYFQAKPPDAPPPGTCAKSFTVSGALVRMGNPL